MRIALDAMGGDFAPSPNIDGALDALAEHENLEMVLVGDVTQLEQLLAEKEYDSQRIVLKASEGVVEMHEKPTEALRKKPNSSIAVCWKLMAAKEVDAVVGAGHTGAIVAAGLRTRLFLKRVKRPGIAVGLPTANGKAVLMDAGANPHARPEHLLQYGVMGSIYAREMLGIEDPKIGLMNIGSEDGKGTELYQLTHQLFLESTLKDRYVGNVEGRGLYDGTADVLISEGFVGNVVLKVSEGIAEFIMESLHKEVFSKLDTDRDKVLAAFRNYVTRFHSAEEGGAPLLGIDGICIICHGSSDGKSIANALGVATTFKDRQINSQMTEELERLNSKAVTST